MKEMSATGERICHLRVKAVEMAAFQLKLAAIHRDKAAIQCEMPPFQTLSPYTPIPFHPYPTVLSPMPPETFTVCQRPFISIPPTVSLAPETNSAHQPFRTNTNQKALYCKSRAMRGETVRGGKLPPRIFSLGRSVTDRRNRCSVRGTMRQARRA